MGLSLVLWDCTEDRKSLLPLVATRPVGNLRVGAFTLDQKWSSVFHSDVSYLTVDRLSTKFPLAPLQDEVLVIQAAILPDAELIAALERLQSRERLIDTEGNWIAFKTYSTSKEDIIRDCTSSSFELVNYSGVLKALHNLEHIFIHNAAQIEFDAAYITFEPTRPTDPHVSVLGNKHYIAASAQLASCTLHTDKGSIIIEENAVVEAGCVIHGPAVIGKNSRVKAGAVIYPNVTVGDNSTVGGELNNTVIWGNSAKGHYGYLGCAVLGEGCNLGAGTSNSNLKNDWSPVKLYSYKDNNYRDTGLLKCGVFIGDHSMLAIASRITTGSVIGVGTQIAMSNFIPNFVQDFSWLTDTKAEKYIFTKFVDMMERKAQAKGEIFTDVDKEILYYIYTENRDN